MAERDLPGLGLRGFWPEGTDHWGDENDANLRKLSAVVQLRALSITSLLPQDDSNSAGVAYGDIYIMGASDSNSLQDSNSIAYSHGSIAVFDEDGWHFFVPRSGWIAYIVDQSQHYKYDGASWVQMGGDAAAIAYSSGDGGDSNSTETTVAGALDDLYDRVRNVAGGIVDASTVQYDSGDGGDSNSVATTVQEALDDLYGSVRVLEDAAGGIQFASITASVIVSAADDKKFYLVGEDSNSGAFIDIGLPEDGLEDLPDGFTVTATQRGASQVRFVAIEDSNSPAGAVLVYPADMTPVTRGQNSVITALKTNVANEWIIFGDLEPV